MTDTEKERERAFLFYFGTENTVGEISEKFFEKLLTNDSACDRIQLVKRFIKTI